MKVIDIYNKIANGEKVPVFTIADDRYKYFMEDGYLYQQKYDYEPQVVEWQIYSDWLNEKIKVIEEDEFEDIEKTKSYEDFEGIDDYIEHLKNKINSLIKNQKKIIEQLKNKD